MQYLGRHYKFGNDQSLLPVSSAAEGRAVVIGRLAVGIYEG